MKRDIFRPSDPLMQRIYDAFHRKTINRNLFNNDWIQRERETVFNESVAVAKENGLRVPTIDVIEIYENCALGHVDYGKKWVTGIVNWMKGVN